MISFIKAILPKKIEKKLVLYLVNMFQKYWEEYNKKIPKIKLEEKNLKNLKAVSNREMLLKLFPKNGIVAEIGIDKGEFSEKIIKINSPAKLHLIDCWGSERYHNGLYEIVKDKFKKEINKGKVEIDIELSTEIVNSFKDGYFDWVYIDTDHSYKITKDELEKYSNKVKFNGIIAGHDYIIGNWNRMKKYGVIEAVDEFCVKNSWEIVYLTMDHEENPSFAIRRIRK
jgi:hypothetical protein